MNRNSEIRLQIMLIALIGGLVFLLYLSVNIVLATVNANRLDSLQDHHYPIIEEIRSIKQDLTSLREGYAAAIGLDDPLLLEDSLILADSILQRLPHLRSRDEQLKSSAQILVENIETYVKGSRSLAEDIYRNPSNLPSYHASMEESLIAFNQVMASLDVLLIKRQKIYGELLAETKAAVNQANVWGALLGGVVIIVLVVLSWLVSKRVLRNINESDRLKDQFLATISHELRTPMNGIMGAHSLLQDTGLDKDQHYWLEIANRSSSNMIMTIDDLLQFSEISAGKAQLNVEECQLRKGIERLLDDTRAQCQEKNLRLKFNDSDILDRIISTNKSRVMFVIRHLLSNAVKFTTQGGVEVSISQVEHSSLGGEAQVRIAVLDTGPGIPEQHMKRLVHPFSQLDGSFSRRHQGMGIGLATCFAIAKLLRGTLTLHNRSSGGLEVAFLFPIEFADHVVSHVQTERPERVQLRTQTQVQSGQTVLVVEDSVVNYLVLAGQLRRQGMTVLRANDGQQALDQVQSHKVDIILMDCQMPVMDGIEATEAIRQLSPPLCDVPIVAVTANGSDLDHQRCLQAGMNGFLMKPVELQSLSDEIMALMPRQEAELT